MSHMVAGIAPSRSIYPPGSRSSDQILVAASQAALDSVRMPDAGAVKVTISGRDLTEAITAPYGRTATGGQTHVSINASRAALDRRRRPGAPAELAGVAVTLGPAIPTFGYNGAGDLTAAGDGTALSYDAAHRTTGITVPGSTAVTMTYRGAGQSERATISDARRVSRDCPEIGGCVPTTTSLGGPATFEHTLLGVTAQTDAASTTYYVRDPRGGLLAQRTPTGGTFYYLLDGLGSVTGMTDGTGSRAASYSYDAYGQTTSMTTSTVAVNNPWRYAGAYQDGTGLYKMGARYYDPALGRFTQQDPVFNPLDPKSWNRYVYVGDDPENYADPSGMSSVRQGARNCPSLGIDVPEGVRETATFLVEEVGGVVIEVAIPETAALRLIWNLVENATLLHDVYSAAYKIKGIWDALTC